MKVSAPGKLVVSGEYAVLEGAPAVVTAVSTRAVAQSLQNRAHPSAPEINAALTLARETMALDVNTLDLDLAQFQSQGQKLGLGSSAAGVVAVLAFAKAKQGADLQDASVRDALFELALKAHENVAPLGSGIDLAASIYGGLLHFQRSGSKYKKEPLSWPNAVYASVVYSGQSAQTHALLNRLLAFKQRAPSAYAELMEIMSQASQRVIRAIEARDLKAILDGIHHYGELMQHLATAADMEIFNSGLRSIVALAKEHQGAAKPSGAGGDCALALFLKPKHRRAFEDKCGAAGLRVIPTEVIAPGVRLEEDRLS